MTLLVLDFAPPEVLRVQELRQPLNDPRVDGEDLDPDQRHPHVGVDHEALVEDDVDHLGQAAAAGPRCAPAFSVPPGRMAPSDLGKERRRDKRGRSVDV